MKNYLVTYREWNGQTGKEEFKSQIHTAIDYDAAVDEAWATFEDLLVSVKSI